jgi:hypothetical protein
MFLRNFLNSIRPRRVYGGDLMGKDRYGNEYYELKPGAVHDPVKGAYIVI